MSRRRRAAPAAAAVACGAMPAGSIAGAAAPETQAPQLTYVVLLRHIVAYQVTRGQRSAGIGAAIPLWLHGAKMRRVSSILRLGTACNFMHRPWFLPPGALSGHHYEARHPATPPSFRLLHPPPDTARNVLCQPRWRNHVLASTQNHLSVNTPRFGSTRSASMFILTAIFHQILRQRADRF